MIPADLSSVDRALGRALGRNDRIVECLVALASHALAEGHVCLPLSTEVHGTVQALLPDVRVPADLRKVLREHSAVRLADEEADLVSQATQEDMRTPNVTWTFRPPRSACPLVLDAAGRLYLARYYDHERRLAGAVVRLLEARTAPPGHVPERTTSGLDTDQARALVSALSGGLTIVSGGPGTGKTSTVVRILAAHLERGKEQRGAFPRVFLLAPTGKAAVRLSESILSAKQHLDAPPEVIQALPTQGSTIHRALGVLPGSRTRFRHGLGAPLDADIVVVDEASMVDLALMRHLLEATPEGASVVLLGDRNQLSSVDAGNVLAELCDALEADPVVARGALCQLTHSHRFGAGQLTALSSAVRAGDAVGLQDALSRSDDSVAIRASDQDDTALCELATRHFRSVLDASDPSMALRQLGRFRALCAHRNGPFGVLGLNAAVQEFLVSKRLVPQGTEYFRGRPILITETDPALELMNGDVGVVWHEPGGKPRVYFERAGRAPLAIAPAHLPSHETAFVMTIHKSQGSEFEHVAVILPPAESPLATRELLYTAITRARERVTLIGDLAALDVAIGRQVKRASGLSSAILSRAVGRPGRP